MKSTQNTGRQIAIFLLLLIAAGSLWNRKRTGDWDQTAELFLEKLLQEISPQTAGLRAQKAFDPNYVEEVIGNATAPVIKLKDSTAHNLATQIHNAWGFWNDDEEAVNSAFRSMKDHVQVAQVAAAYEAHYRVSLLEKLIDRLDAPELQEVLDIVRDLPPYRTKNS